MANFRIKSLAPFFTNIMGVRCSTNEVIDLLSTHTASEIKESLLFGELYDKLQGRMIAIATPSADIPSLGLTDAEYNILTYAGFFQGLMGTDDLKYPLQFSNDGYLLATVVSGGGVTSEISVRGVVADGTTADSFPVEIGGVDEDGYIQSLLVSSDGELHIRAYDAPSDAIRTFETAPVNTTFLLETLIDDSNLAVDTYYYTVTMDNYKDLSLEFELDSVSTMTVEASNDNTFATPKDITLSGNELVSNTNGYPSFSNSDGIVDFDNLNVTYVRVKLVISNATNTVKIVARKKAL